MTGITLQWFIVIYAIVPGIMLSEACASTVLKADISSIDDLTDVHDCIAKHRSGWLAFSSLFLIGYPVMIAHIYFDYRLAETIFSFMNVNVIRAFLWGSWLVSITILCTILPSLSIFISYYEWEFEESNKYVGYAMQLQFLHLFQILFDSVTIPLGIAASMPWIVGLVTIFNCCPSKVYKFNEKERTRFVASTVNLPFGKYCIALIMFVVVLICLFASLGDGLDFKQNGFWSYHGGSQWLGIFLCIVWEITAILYIIFGLKFEDQTKFLNKNVETLASQDAGSAVEMQ